jgi:hypothetical protein
MLRYFATLLLPALLVLGSVSPADAQWGPPYSRPGPGPGGWMGGGIAGDYLNTSAGGYCHVYQQGNSFIFVNEKGDRARFIFAGPGRLRMVGGDWNPNTIVLVNRARSGRTRLDFKEPGSPTGRWVKVD